MESSQLFGGAEECHSSESGWTMYLGSHIHGTDDYDDDDDDDNQHNYERNDDEDGGNGKNYYQEDDSDDSMASDASSGPSNQGTDFKLQKDVVAKYESQRKPNSKQVEKHQKAERRRKEDNNSQEVGFMPRKVNNKSVPTQSTSKVRKSISWMGKRK